MENQCTPENGGDGQLGGMCSTHTSDKDLPLVCLELHILFSSLSSNLCICVELIAKTMNWQHPRWFYIPVMVTTQGQTRHFIVGGSFINNAKYQPNQTNKVLLK